MQAYIFFLYLPYKSIDPFPSNPLATHIFFTLLPTIYSLTLSLPMLASILFFFLLFLLWWHYGLLHSFLFFCPLFNICQYPQTLPSACEVVTIFILKKNQRFVPLFIQSINIYLVSPMYLGNMPNVEDMVMSNNKHGFCSLIELKISYGKHWSKNHPKKPESNCIQKQMPWRQGFWSNHLSLRNLT